MDILITHNAVSDESAPDEQDVLVQAEAVAGALAKLGHRAILLPCNLDLHTVQCRVKEFKPDRVFNLVESLDGEGRLIHLFPTLLDAMKMPYTGSCAEAIFMTSHKIMAKERMVLSNLPTAPWIGPYPEDIPCFNRCKDSKPTKKITQWIVKSLWEHASIGLEEDGLLTTEHLPDIEKMLKKRVAQFGGAWFAEAYIEGREFNLSLLADSGQPMALPPAEIRFEGYEPGKPRIVGYRAKWDADSFEYQHTIRSFSFPPEDDLLLENLKAIAIRCWKAFGLNGYVRVDFRVDAEGQPWILEINTNPCLSPDAGFAAAVEQAGLSFADAIGQILSD